MFKQYFLYFSLSPSPLPQSSFPAAGSPVNTGAWDYSSLGAGICISLCWASQGSCWPISLACQGPSKWRVSHASQACIICRPSEGALSLVMQVLNEDVQLC